MKYPIGTRLRLTQSGASDINANRDTDDYREFEEGDIVTIGDQVDSEYTDTYTLPEIDWLPDGWSQNFVEDIKNFVLESPNWREILRRK